ncbi:DUF6328 family protein [Vitiosangium sp. GDMCC 1.1324]|uniref:DUF6328 family protein n=1 Tax=Vitiosangium sp. (strain GDMCC 1.1324) TaxID=2138576 RepID=UPI000D3A8A25|nr:DUF6328 family protein [Vitiosangium sp. GDMCC 1.1324]PTL84402.1 hypothetical protein DAT35_04720 [Vitiosangium sp. GDMCC 1.1324]
MAELKNKIQNGLDEARILILGTQVLIGFGFRLIFEDRFPELPATSQRLLLVDLGLLLMTFALLVTLSAWHRIVERGEDTPGFLRTISSLMWPTLLPISVALGINLFVAGEKVLGRTGGLALGLGGAGVSLVLLYGLEEVQRHRYAPDIQRRQDMSNPEQAEGKTGIEDKIRHVLTEARVILPGAQALLGFQFVIILMRAFDELPASSKLVHLASLALVVLSTILLMTPAAYHRIVERGEETEHFHRFASRVVIASLVPLALGLSGDLYVVVRKVMGSVPMALTAAAVCLVACYGLWFGLPLARRARQTSRPPLPPRSSHPAHA